MGFIYEERASDSPYLDAVTRGHSEGEGFTIRPAECQWHMVLARLRGETRMIVTGPCTTSGVVRFTDGVELLWIRLKLGTYMPHLPTRSLLDVETTLPEATCASFRLAGDTWQFPDFTNVETFIAQLARRDVLARDPLVSAVLADEPHALADRTVRHRFLRATGLTQAHIHQVARAQRAAALLQQGKPILDTVHVAGYFDQPHLTRSLKHFIGHTPAQLARLHTPE
jgi:AraC-like DNA-binding protein